MKSANSNTQISEGNKKKFGLFHSHVSPSIITVFEDLYSNFPDYFLIHNYCMPSTDKASREVSTSFVCGTDGPLMMNCIWYTHPTPHPGHRHDEYDVGSDVPSVTLNPPTQALTTGGETKADQWGGQDHHPGQAHQLHHGTVRTRIRRLESSQRNLFRKEQRDVNASGFLKWS